MILYTRQEDTRKMKIVDEYFGCDVFSTSAMQRYLPHAVYKQMMDVMEKGKELPKEIADVVANAMKDWAMDKGATHYTHWFQPMTGITAEKHDAFINPTGPKVNPMPQVFQVEDCVPHSKPEDIPHGIQLL